MFLEKESILKGKCNLWRTQVKPIVDTASLGGFLKGLIRGRFYSIDRLSRSRCHMQIVMTNNYGLIASHITIFN